MRKSPYEVRVHVANDDVPNLFRDCLCSGSIGFGSLRIEYTSEDYQEAKQVLLQRKPDQTICWEDVITEILNLGFYLTFVDVEDDTKYKINLQTIRNNVPAIQFRDMNAMMNERDDAITHDSILQCLILGDVIYG